MNPKCPQCETKSKKKWDKLRPTYHVCEECGFKWHEYPGGGH